VKKFTNETEKRMVELNFHMMKVRERDEVGMLKN
jgi:hypothetical protein